MHRNALVFSMALVFAVPAVAQVVVVPAPVVKPATLIVSGTPEKPPPESKPPVREVAKWTARWLEKPVHTWIDPSSDFNVRIQSPRLFIS